MNSARATIPTLSHPARDAGVQAASGPAPAFLKVGCPWGGRWQLTRYPCAALSRNHFVGIADNTKAFRLQAQFVLSTRRNHASCLPTTR